jgi:hypothetical protein
VARVAIETWWRHLRKSIVGDRKTQLGRLVGDLVV